MVGMPDEKLGERMCAYVTPVPGDTVSLEDLCDHLASVGVAKYKYPERIEIIEAIPRNPVGKILKKKSEGRDGGLIPWPVRRQPRRPVVNQCF